MIIEHSWNDLRIQNELSPKLKLTLGSDHVGVISIEICWLKFTSLDCKFHLFLGIDQFINHLMNELALGK